nr:zinc finger BED domain-containing protein RICESLEEPER 2 [Tanacetum cinerariifolium]
MSPLITCSAALNPCFNVSGVELIIDSISTDLECFDDGFATKAKQWFNDSLEGFDVLGFSKAKESMFHIISQMAMDLYSVQATSVASKYDFSTNGMVLSIQRTRLTPASLKMCMCLKDHMDATERIQHTSNLENALDFEEEILDEQVQQNEVTPLSDEEITLDEADSEARSNVSRSGGEEFDMTLSD